MSRLPISDLKPKQAFRLQKLTSDGGLGGSGSLFGGTGAVVNGTTYSEVVATGGSARIRARILTATATGNLTIAPIAPEAETAGDEGVYDPKLGIDPTKVTAYSTGTVTAAVAAATETKADLDLYGETHCLVSFACTLTGTITFCDVSQV